MADYLPGTEVVARGLRWEVVDGQPRGNQTRLRLHGLGGVLTDMLPSICCDYGYFASMCNTSRAQEPVFRGQINGFCYT